ncbi:formylglycine-generating enzyme family protein [Arvimicrobium flavum]|uniref:formylglycine-generating enzyme family protein n=1 Tax=Arvimicrobium flavum TaxID=3393320 RepID=UPI00237BEAA5|nr:formylglycine-generating enzyme family protein [Mesorhizobium shangrilense]
MTKGCCTPTHDRREGPASAAPLGRSGSAPAFDWRRLDGGAFLMGNSEAGRFADDGEGPQRRVTVSPFAIAALTVTNDQFAAFVADTGYLTQAEREGWSSVFHMLLSPLEKRKVRQVPRETPWWYPVEGACWSRPEGPQSSLGGRGGHPVVHVSWDDAQAYCRWAGVSLPSEAQWEYAARGGLEGALYPWGDELTPAGEHRCNIWQGRFPTQNSAEDGHIGTAPASAYRPNGFGLHNAVGNVWQWCADTFSSDYHRTTPALDPLHDDGGERSMRGGSHLCHASYCDRYRCAARTGNDRRTSTSNIGFRVVMRGDRPA